MIICLRNNGNKGKTTATKKMIEVVLGKDYKLIEAYHQGFYDVKINEEELNKALTQDGDLFTLFQHNTSHKFLAIITGGDYKETIHKWFEILIPIIGNLGILAEQLHIICTAKDCMNGARGVAKIITDYAQKEPFNNCNDIIMGKSPYIFSTEKSINREYMNSIYQNFAQTTIKFIETHKY